MRRAAITLAWILAALVGSVVSAAATADPLVHVRLTASAGPREPPLEVPRTLLLPAGWRAEVWARVKGARFAVWTPNGGLLVSVPALGDVVLLSPGADPAARPRPRVLLTGLLEPEGLGFDVLGGRPVLYVAEPTELDRYTWPGLRRTVVTRGLPDADGLDRLKGLVVASDHTVYVGVGSDSLLGGPRGVILAVRPGGSRTVAARGVRYAEGLAEDPTGRLWAAVNSAGTGRDNLAEISSGHAVVRLTLPAHTAPLGLTFLTRSSIAAPWRDGAVLAAHGARDPASPSVPVVLWLPWNGRTLGRPVTLVGGFQEGRTRWGRPADAVVGPDGSLYVVDDTAGAIYRLTPP